MTAAHRCCAAGSPHPGNHRSRSVRPCLMRYGSAAAFRTALEARLGTESQSTGLTLVRLRKSSLYASTWRLLAVAPDRKAMAASA